MLQSPRNLKLILAYLCCYLASHWVTYIFVYTDFGVTPWNPETGLSFVFSALIGPFAFPAILAANLLGERIVNPLAELSGGLLRAVLYAGIYTAAGTLFAKIATTDRPGSIHHLLKLLLVASLAALAFGILLVVGIGWLYQMPSPRILSAIVTAATGDLIGIVTILPLFIVWQLMPPLNVLTWRTYSIMGAGAVVVITASVIVFGLDSTDQFKFFYLILVPVVACSLLYGFTGAALSVIASDVCMVAIIYLRDVTPGTATELQILMITLSVTGLLLGSVVSERSRLSLQLVESHQKLSDAQSRLLHASRVLLINEMASAIAHEINQPLSAIRNFTRAIQRSLSKKPLDRGKLESLIDAAVSQVDAASTIINDTRRFVRRDTSGGLVASVSDCVALCLRLLHAEVKKSEAEVRTDIPEHLRAMIPAVKLQQVLLNLIRNSIEAVEHADDRRIEISCVPSSEGFARLTVTDSGPGIPEDIRAELFRPFATSKETGLGLGLPLSLSIVNEYGGQLWIAQPGPGRTSIAFSLRTVVWK